MKSGCHASRVSGLGVQVIHTYIDIILKVIHGQGAGESLWARQRV